MLVGPHASKAEREAFAEKLKADPDNYIAQPTIQLSTAPSFVDGGIEPRHVDLRPFILHGEKTTIVPGRADARGAASAAAWWSIPARAAARRTPGCLQTSLMLSRVADSLYWMGRYIERAEHTARLIAVKLESMIEQTQEDADRLLARVVAAPCRPKNSPRNRTTPSPSPQALAFDRAQSVFAGDARCASRATMRARCASSFRPKCGSI